MNRDYKEDILKILGQEGEIFGFNTLKERGKFHPNRLKAHLDQLEKSGDIAIDRSNKEYVYSFIRPKIEEKYQKLTKDLKDIDRSLKTPDLKPDERAFLLSNYVKLVFYHQDIFKILSLWPEGTEFNKQDYMIGEKFQENLSRDVKIKLKEVSDLERSKVLNVILSSYKEKPHLISLSKYREVTHKPTAKEKRETKLRELKMLEESFQKTPYCMFCGYKPRDYVESEKHEKEHEKSFGKHPMQSIKSFEGIHCMVCGKLVGFFDELEKHKCKNMK